MFVNSERESDKDFVVIGGKKTVITHEKTDNTNGKLAATGETQAEAF